MHGGTTGTFRAEPGPGYETARSDYFYYIAATHYHVSHRPGMQHPSAAPWQQTDQHIRSERPGSAAGRRIGALLVSGPQCAKVQTATTEPCPGLRPDAWNWGAYSGERSALGAKRKRHLDFSKCELPVSRLDAGKYLSR